MSIALLGGIGLTEIQVYDQRRAPDGLFGGCPHVHAVCDEGYLILDGQGWVELHCLDGTYHDIPLAAGDYLHFPPAVVHRLVTRNSLRLLGLMSNAGLAEAGDARVYFGPEIDQDAQRYQACWALPKDKGLDGALERRDLSVQAYMTLQNLRLNALDEYRHELRRFVQTHLETCTTKKQDFASALKHGPLQWGRRTQNRLDTLPQMPASIPILRHTAPVETRLGMCGILKPYLSPDAIT